ncbi:MAG: DUF1446 domain-containing protein [Deltaproteobacteria bacterium]|nr:DUF1446 domain-containing protein [Deltaproteobacteria bacterium]
MSGQKSLRIGNAGGYWGDDPGALKRQIDGGDLDYITMDFLAEVTMSIMRKQMAKDPESGYAKDFISMLKGVLPDLLQKKIRLITNAGGMNPRACARAVRRQAEELGLSPRIAVVCGDDILGDVDTLEEQGADFSNMETQQPFSLVRDRLEAANVYFGVVPVLAALRRWQPDILITGRVTDTGITLAPMMYEWGWSLTDYDKLAAGIVAGHMLECGSQITGGNFSDWKKVPDFKEIGYPIVEMYDDGTFFITKHANTGGLVTVDTVREQVFYEMGNPAAYLSPDVVADFRSIFLEQAAKDRVRVSRIRGYAPTSHYKVSMAYRDGFKSSGLILISGPEARSKAETFAGIFWERCPGQFKETLTEYLGWNACHRSLGLKEDGNEIVLKLAVRSDDADQVRGFAKLIPSLILSGPPGVAVLGGVPAPQSVISYWPALIPKQLICPQIALLEGDQLTEAEDAPGTVSALWAPSEDQQIQVAREVLSSPENLFSGQSQSGTFALSELALARSGDKGDSVNIGVLARSDAAWEFLKEYLTAQRVKDWFQELCYGQVTRYTLEGLKGLNFILEAALGGGGSCTLRSDAQGKTFSQALLRQKVPVPEQVMKSVRIGDS